MTEGERFLRRLETDLAGDDFAAGAATLQTARDSLGDSEAASLVAELALPKSLGLVAYAFVGDLIRQRDEAFFHYAAASLLATSLCHLPSAYDAALFHARRAAMMAPSIVEYQWFVLFVTSSPDPNQVVARAAAAEAVYQIESAGCVGR